MRIYEGYYNDSFQESNQLNEAKVEILPFDEIDGNPDYIYTLDKNNKWKPIINLAEAMRKLPNSEAEDACELLGKAKLISYYIGEGGYYYNKISKAHDALKNYNLTKLKDNPNIREKLGNDIKTTLLSYYSVKTEYYKNLLFDDNGTIKRITIRLSSHWEHQKPQEREISIVFPDEESYKENNFDLNKYSVGNYEFVDGKDFINNKSPKQIAEELKQLIDKAKTQPIKKIELLRILDNRVERVFKQKQEYKNAIKMFSEQNPNIDEDFRKIIKFVIEHKDEYVHDFSKIPTNFGSNKNHNRFWLIFNKLRTPEENELFKKARAYYDEHRYDSTGGVIPSNKVTGYSKFFKLMTEFILSPQYKDNKVTYDELYGFMKKHHLNWSKENLYRVIKTYNYENPEHKFIPKLKRTNHYQEFKDAILDLTDGETTGDYIFPIEDWIRQVRDFSEIDMTKSMFHSYYKKLLQEYPDLKLLKTRSLDKKLVNKIIDYFIEYCSNKYNKKQTLQEWSEFFQAYLIDISKGLIQKICKKVEEQHPEFAPIIKKRTNENISSSFYNRLMEDITRIIVRHLNSL